MKKHIILSSLILVPFLMGCKSSKISTPKSPFKDTYVRIGMEGTYEIANPMSNDEYSELKSYIASDATEDKNVESYRLQQEDRDLKYAYFGKESSSISQCTMTSTKENLDRYQGPMFIDDITNERQVQTANAGIQKTTSLTTDYTFDSSCDPENVENDESHTYEKRLRTKINDEPEKITQELDPTGYSDLDVENIFGLKPFTKRIKSHFIEAGKYKFKLFAENNNAVYGKTRDNKYVIKEGYSLFDNFSTTMGRTYKAVDNYFYEGLLERYQINDETYSYRFLNFRFYHELLILSKAFDGTNVPVLYLDKPVLIVFNETTYSEITYCDGNFKPYEGTIPKPTPVQ